MKTIMLSIFFFAAVISAKSQIANTKWKGTIQGDQPVEVVFDFGKDTLKVENVGDGSLVETMTYTLQDSILSVQKVEGQSECDNDAVGKYKYIIKDNEISFLIVTDDCQQRLAVLTSTSWTKVQP